ncbi:thiamine pyrophosphate-dependent enzyme [Ignisphaera sp. 4213-co]|uniref:2-oxoacid oxidoreductase (ferredoxin) n=1 Tax=Ignisphaera cupida TaxID=3050454 RepID=A0ABD4Z8W1_9CREN|nr:thiamine pyrophosphate-dependent enzyme [Ignisphaera sp. 4213-co]MDK6029472.1 thiamine pyrophosphate-dependent enzyme [Ignisphaera sp. 4213-co]
MSSPTKPGYKTVFDIPRDELFAPGHGLCAGCTAGTIVRLLLKVAGPNTIVVNPTGCVEVSTTTFPFTSWRVPYIHVAFENAAAVASGVEAAIKILKKKGVIDSNKQINVVVFAGDGGTADIGIQALSGMLERGHKVMYVMYDNEAYMNTGIQRSGTTPQFAWTTTTPVGKILKGKLQIKKPMAEIAAAHRIPYVATANPAHFLDMMNKFRRGLEVEGPSFIHVLQPCTTGWRFDPRMGIKLARLATETAMWINWELDHGEFRVTVSVPKRKHVKHYLRLQGRFNHLTDADIEEIQKYVDKEVERINKMVGKEVIGPVVE